MQDRYLVIAIIMILAICCLGGYVAVSGYLNSSPSTLGGLTTGVASTPISRGGEHRYTPRGQAERYGGQAP